MASKRQKKKYRKQGLLKAKQTRSEDRQVQELSYKIARSKKTGRFLKK